MKKSKIIISTLLISFILITCAKKESPKPLTDSKAEAQPTKMLHKQQVKHGKYLVDIMGCHDCHSPKIMTNLGPVPDPDFLLSGHLNTEKLATISDPKVLQNYAMCNMNLTAWVGPWGTSFAANLTPDETGLGNWTIENFEKAMREGKFKGMDNGRMLLPPMPWQNFSYLTDGDLKAIWAYLQSIPPVKNIVPAPVPPAS